MITNHVLDGAITTDQTANVSGEIKPKYLVLYGTHDTWKNVVYDFCERDDIKESAHLVITPGGDILQLAPFNVKTWHAGASYWQGYHGLNGYAIGVYVCLLDGVMTAEAYDALHEIIPDIVAEYNIRGVVPHTRPHTVPLNVDPFRQYVEYGNADSVGRFVATAGVDIKGGPDVQYATVDRISAGEGVKVLRYSQDAEWAFVLYERKDHVPRQGWTHESFLRRI